MGVHWAAFLPAAFLMAAIPGANQVLSIRNAIRNGARPTVISLVGRFSAFLLMVGAVAVGMGPVLESSARLLTLIKWAGVVFLIYLGVRMLWARPPDGSFDKWHTTPRPSAGPSPHPDRQPWHLARQEFMVAVANPKAYLLFAMFLPQFIGTGSRWSFGAQLISVGCVYIAVEFICASVYVLAGSRVGTAGLTTHVKRWIDRISGISIIGLALWLAHERQA